MLPFALKYLLTFGSDLVEAKWAIGEYISFVTSLLLWVGVSFETPMIIFFLAKLHVVNVKKLSAYRKYAIVGAFVLAAVITPTPDPFNQLDGGHSHHPALRAGHHPGALRVARTGPGGTAPSGRPPGRPAAAC